MLKQSSLSKLDAPKSWQAPTGGKQVPQEMNGIAVFKANLAEFLAVISN